MRKLKQNKLINQIDVNDYQFIIFPLLLILVFLITDIFYTFNKIEYAYSNSIIPSEIYRLFTCHFLHKDLNHLLSNIGGVIIARYYFKQLKLNNRYFFIYLVLLIIPIQSFIMIFADNYLIKKDVYYAYGFSGIIYGIDSFLLLISLMGKRTILNLELNIKKNRLASKSLSILTYIGIIYSLFPGISLTAHLAGLIAGSIIFLL